MDTHDKKGPGGGADNGHGQDMVDIVINGTTVTVHRGSTTVSELKAKGGVPAGYELALETPETSPPFSPLDDNGRFTIKGGERFISYPKDSGSSGPGSFGALAHRG